MAGKIRDNPLLNGHEFKFDPKVRLQRRFPNPEQAKPVAQALRRAGFDARLFGKTIILMVPEVLALKAKTFGQFM